MEKLVEVRQSVNEYFLWSWFNRGETLCPSTEGKMVILSGFLMSVHWNGDFSIPHGGFACKESQQPMTLGWAGEEGKARSRSERSSSPLTSAPPHHRSTSPFKKHFLQAQSVVGEIVFCF